MFDETSISLPGSLERQNKFPEWIHDDDDLSERENDIGWFVYDKNIFYWCLGIFLVFLGMHSFLLHEIFIILCFGTAAIEFKILESLTKIKYFV